MALMERSNNHQDQELLQAHDELWHQSLSYLKSLALAVALDLGIPDAIHRHGGGATLPHILAETALHPCKLRPLRRLMRALTVSGTFSVVVQQTPASGDDSTVDASDETVVVYGLTAASRFLVSDSDDEVSSASATATLAPFMRVLLRPISLCPHAMGICAWFRQERHDPSALGLAFPRGGATFWERADDGNAIMNQGLAAHSRFLMPIVLRECGEAVFRGVDSLVDVGGGHGGAAAAIAAAFPHLKCSVLDLPHVVASAPPSDTDSNVNNVQFVAGDMFQSIPPATAVFLKKVLHDWGDEECVKILKNCRQAISPRDAGGKVIILDMVVGHELSNIKYLETQVMFDLFIMMLNGVERDEQEWSKIFIEAGFRDYKIRPIVGTLSVIEVYP